MENVYLKSVELTDIGKFRHIKFEAGAITIISGKNAEGKSTILNAIQDVFDGGHDPSLIRDFGKPNAAEKGEIILQISDGATIRKWITADGYEVKARTGEGVPIKRVKEYLDSLAKSFALDPLALMDCPAKDRAKFVAEAMPLSFGAEEVNAALGVSTQVRSLDLAGVNGLRDAKYEDRKGCNATVKRLDGAIAESRQALGDEDAKDWGSELSKLDGEIESLRTDLAAAKLSISSQVQQACFAADRKACDAIAEIKAACAAEIRRLEQEGKQVYEHGATGCSARIADLSVDRGRLAAQADQQKRNAGLRAGLAKMSEECRKATFESERLTAQIEAIDRLKLEKLKTLPVPGVEVKNGDVCVDGVTWEHVNTGERIKVSIAFAALRLGKLPLMITDRMESLDRAGKETVKAVAKEMGLQIIAAVVGEEGELKIEAALAFGSNRRQG